MRIAVGADHAGVPLNERIIEELRRSGHEVIDFGTHDSAAPDDYPDHARMVGESIQQGRVERGILVCGSGVGACVADVAKLEPGPGQVLVKIGGAAGVSGLMAYFHRELVDAMLHLGVDTIASLGRAHVARVG
jgi:hypothetical protein